jgi:methyl-accepting chemotaxis protein
LKISNLIKKIQCSTLIKLLFVIIITGIIVILLVGGFLKYYSSQLYLPFIKNISHYTNYIIREIGTPPDILKALEIAQDLSLHIRFESSNLQWTTDDKLISFKEFDKLTSDENEQIKTDIEEGIYFVAVNQDLGRYLFAFDFKKSTHDKEVLVILMFILLTLVFLFAYLSIRWILKPIKWLTEGVKQVSKGNLNFQIPIRKMDDLGELTESFNSMTRRIAEMIHAKEQLLLDVSHEIRSPLTRIKVALEFVPDGNTKKSIGEDRKIRQRSWENSFKKGRCFGNNQRSFTRFSK